MWLGMGEKRVFFCVCAAGGEKKKCEENERTDSGVQDRLCWVSECKVRAKERARPNTRDGKFVGRLAMFKNLGWQPRRIGDPCLGVSRERLRLINGKCVSDL